jgi:hypothetical protein
LLVEAMILTMLSAEEKRTHRNTSRAWFVDEMICYTYAAHVPAMMLKFVLLSSETTAHSFNAPVSARDTTGAFRVFVNAAISGPAFHVGLFLYDSPISGRPSLSQNPRISLPILCTLPD